MHSGWNEIMRDDDPFDAELLTPPPFCFEIPDDREWHVTAAQTGEMIPGRFRPAKGVKWRPACADLEVVVQEIPVHRQPTCTRCREAVKEAVKDALKLKIVVEVL